MNTLKKRVLVVYGGQSTEHEISLVSAAFVLKNLDPKKYEIIPLAIDQRGRWLLDKNATKLLEQNTDYQLPSPTQEVILTHEQTLLPLHQQSQQKNFDVVFPVLHGPLGEDGTIQGLFELAQIAYVGCNVLSSALCMDKEMLKKIAQQEGLSIVPYLAFNLGQWQQASDHLLKQIQDQLKFPLFVKPAHLGSSVGIRKVKEISFLKDAILNAFQYDEKVVIEEGINNVREIEVAVLENSTYGLEPLTSAPGEVKPNDEFYSYEAKKNQFGEELCIPADLTPAQVQQAQQLAKQAFLALNCEGMARVDLFLTESGDFLFNEVNTIPGLTSTSLYPLLWEYSGVPPTQLLDHLIELALQKQQRKQKLKRSS